MLVFFSRSSRLFFNWAKLAGEGRGGGGRRYYLPILLFILLRLHPHRPSHSGPGGHRPLTGSSIPTPSPPELVTAVAGEARLSRISQPHW